MQDKQIIIYDEDCGFCTWCRKQVEVHDTNKRFTFIGIDTPQAQEFLQAHGQTLDTNNPESFVLIDNNQWFEQSRAVKKITRELTLPWSGLYWVLVLTPTPLADWGYRFMAKHRSRLGRILGEKSCSL